MPRMGKKTLYLDLDALDRLDAALSRLPGRPSLSSYLSSVIPQHAEQMELMVRELEKGGVRALATLFIGAGQTLQTLEADVTDLLQEAEQKGKADVKLSEMVKDVPPKKARKSSSKKVVET